jgi:hypothetical protein
LWKEEAHSSLYGRLNLNSVKLGYIEKWNFLHLEEKKEFLSMKEGTASSWVKSKMLRIHHILECMVSP